jgi:hypothetical protein
MHQKYSKHKFPYEPVALLSFCSVNLDIVANSDCAKSINLVEEHMITDQNNQDRQRFAR